MSHTASKMGILSHRGLWRAPEEKNTTAAFLRSFELGFGTETDIRDCDGKLVISHDPPEARAEPLPLHVFLDLYDRHGNGLPLALNIKADGLQSRVCDHITAYGIRNYFCFDMSVPDTRGYLAQGLQCFTRQSEYEPDPTLYARAAGVWMDAFERDWVGERDVERHLTAGKRVCIVSPELHRRERAPFWSALRTWTFDAPRGDVLFCTDWPVEAKECFNA
jgi:hypothetical protein